MLPNYLTLYSLIKAQAEKESDATAIAAPERKPLNYRGLHGLIKEFGTELNLMGLGRGDRVAIVLPNGPEMAAAFLATACAATSAPLNPGYREPEFDFYLSDLKARAVIVQSGIDSPARNAAKARGIPIIELSPVPEAGAGMFRLTGEKSADAALTGPAEPGDVALVLHTSGTTSRPKIVPLTQGNICTSAANIRETLRLNKNDRCLNVMPLFHIHGLIGVVLSSMKAGASIFCTPGFDAGKFFEWIEAFQPTWYSAVPTMHQAILSRSEANGAIIQRASLRFIRSSSASLPPQVMAALEKTFNAPVIESYGMTEAAHQMASNPLPPRKRKAGSVGIAAGPEIAIMDEAGNLVKTGETGEIVIRGDNVTPGYDNNPTANQDVFVNGWFRTGDQGYFDADQYLFIKGRIKEIINRGGEKISPREVDEAIIEHPSVAQVVTFAVPHHTLGEDVAAAVILHPDSAVDAQQIREFAFTQLADFKVPSQVIIVEEIPKGPTGKLQRIGLADKLAGCLKAEYVAPGNELEEKLAGIWAEVLNINLAGVHDNFFLSGGDSILATQVVSRIHAAFRIDFLLGTIFKKPTIAEQAVLIEETIIAEIEKMTEEEAQRSDRQKF